LYFHYFPQQMQTTPCKVGRISGDEQIRPISSWHAGCPAIRDHNGLPQPGTDERQKQASTCTGEDGGGKQALERGIFRRRTNPDHIL